MGPWISATPGFQTGEQTLDLQRDALAKAGCDKVFEETASGAKADRLLLRKRWPTPGPATPWWSGASTAWAAPCPT